MPNRKDICDESTKAYGYNYFVDKKISLIMNDWGIGHFMGFMDC